MNKLEHAFLHIIRRIRLPEYIFCVLVAFMIGIFSAIGNYCFVSSVGLLFNHIFLPVYHFFHKNLVLLLPFVPIIGALSLFVLAKLTSLEVYGYGFPKFIIDVNLHGGFINIRQTILKILGSIITLGLGGSAGREGPIAQLGGVIGTIVSRLFKGSETRLRTFIACGCAGGIAATFNAPLAGVFFAQEIVLLGEFEFTSFMPIVVSAGTSTILARALYMNKPLFDIPPYNIRSFWELGFYILLGIFLGILSYLFLKIFYGTKAYFDKIKIHPYFKPFLGFSLVGLIGIFFPWIFGNGYTYVQEALSGNIVGTLMFALVFFKMLATSITLGSGGTGGMFAPSLYIGAMAGGCFGVIIHHFFPTLTAPYPAYAIVGMGGFLAALTHAPVTAIFLAFEMTDEYRIILPILFASITGTVTAYALSQESIDTYELSQRGINLHAGREANVMASISVEEAMTKNVITVPKDMKLKEFLRFIRDKRHTCFPVVNENGELAGIVSFQDFREILAGDAPKDRLTIDDICTKNVITITPDQNLRDALEKMRYKNIERLPVVDAQNSRKLVGLLSQRDIINVYNKALLEYISHRT